MNIELTIISLDEQTEVAPQKIVTKSKEITLGRSDDNDLVLDQPEISGRHAKIRIGQNEVQKLPTLYLTDLSSSNGTYLENNRLGANIEVLVLPNERIRIGNYLIKPVLIDEDIKEDLSEEELEVARDLISLDVALNEVADSTNSITEDKVKVRPKTVKLNGDATKHNLERVKIKPTPAMLDEELDEIKTNGISSLTEQTKKGLKSAFSGFKSSLNGTASADEEEIEIHFVAQKLFTIQGKVLRNDQPLAGVTIDAGPLGKVETDEKGIFIFNNIPEKTEFSLEASKSGYLFECKETSGSLKNNIDVVINAKKLLTIKGSVIRDGKPLEGVEVDGGSLGVALTDKDGVYRFKDVPEGTNFNLTAKKDGFTIHTSS